MEYQPTDSDVRYSLTTDDPVAVVQTYADSLHRHAIRLGWRFYDQRRPAEANQNISEVLLAILHVAACGLHLVGCIGARIGCGIAVLEGVTGCDNSFVWWWQQGRPRETWYCEVAGTNRSTLTELFATDKEPDRWRRTSFVQFLLADEESVQSLRNNGPGVPNLGGPHCPRLPTPRRPDPPPTPTPIPRPPSNNDRRVDDSPGTRSRSAR